LDHGVGGEHVADDAPHHHRIVHHQHANPFFLHTVVGASPSICSFSITESRVNGFMMYSFAPLLSALAICSISVSVVTMRIFTPSYLWSALTAQRNSKPFIRGMFQSTSAKSTGAPFSSCSSASL